MPRVYIETTIPSLYTSYPSNQLTEAAKQNITKEWWDFHTKEFQLVCSESVLKECRRGDAEMAKLRLELIRDLPLLEMTEEVFRVAEEILRRQIIPDKAAEDAFHIAVSSVHAVDYLVTWNCKHIANPRNWRRISDCLADFGYRASVICTPEELLEDPDE